MERKCLGNAEDDYEGSMNLDFQWLSLKCQCFCCKELDCFSSASIDDLLSDVFFTCHPQGQPMNATERLVFWELPASPSSVSVRLLDNWDQLHSFLSDHRFRFCRNQWQQLWRKPCWFDQMELQTGMIHWSMGWGYTSWLMSSSSSVVCLNRAQVDKESKCQDQRC